MEPPREMQWGRPCDTVLTDEILRLAYAERKRTITKACLQRRAKSASWLLAISLLLLLKALPHKEPTSAVSQTMSPESLTSG